MRYRYSGESYIRRKNDESQLQMMIVRWLENKNIFYVASLMGVNLGWKAGGLHKRRGCKAGTHDLIILMPSRGFHGMTLELKVKGGRELSAQVGFMKRATDLGYYSVIMPTNLDFNAAYNWAIRELEAYLNLKEV